MFYVLHKLRYCLSSQHIPNGTHMLIGLGNPGKAYESTRHNVGQAFIRYYAKQHNIQLKDGYYGAIGQHNHIILFNPCCFMNASGTPIKKVLLKSAIPISNILVVHDDLDQDIGKCKIKLGGSAEGHNGLKSIIQQMDPGFRRLKFGIGRPHTRELVSEYVLGKTDFRLMQTTFRQGLNLIGM